jgi:hypothetical protein
MSYTRRSLAGAIVALALAMASASTSRSHPQQPSSPQPRPYPNAPKPEYPEYPPRPNGPEERNVDKREIARENQAKIKVDVEKLYELVGELREQVQKSDVTSTLSVSVVNKAKQIEKLAKQVKDRAKG